MGKAGNFSSLPESVQQTARRVSGEADVTLHHIHMKLALVQTCFDMSTFVPFHKGLEVTCDLKSHVTWDPRRFMSHRSFTSHLHSLAVQIKLV
jgi:hypothetical protein